MPTFSVVEFREHRRVEVARDLDHREVTGSERAAQGGRLSLAIRGGHLDGRRSGDDVIVGDDIAVGVIHDPGSQSDVGLNLHDRKAHVLDDRDERVLQVNACGTGCGVHGLRGGGTVCGLAGAPGERDGSDHRARGRKEC